MAPFKNTELKSDWRSDFLIEENDCDCEGCGQDPCIKCGESHHNINEEKTKMSDKDFKRLNKDMHDTAKAGGGASQEIQNKYALELSRRRKNNKDGTFSIQTNKALEVDEELQGGVSVETYTNDTKFTEIETVDIIKTEPLKSTSITEEVLVEDFVTDLYNEGYSVDEINEYLL